MELLTERLSEATEQREQSAWLLSRMGSVVRSSVPSIVALIPAIVLYFYFVTGATGDISVSGGSYYQLLGAAFASGQLHLLNQPSPALLALDNPYDPRTNHGISMHDASLYDGKFFLYWGPFPGVVHAIWRVSFGAPLNEIAVLFVLMVLACIGFWLILIDVRRQSFPTVSNLVVIVLLLQFSLGPTMLFLMSRPSHYHEAPIFGLALLIVSWLFFFRFLRTPGSGRASLWNLALSGTFLGAAVASRAPLVAYAIGPSLLLGYRLVRSIRSGDSSTVQAGCRVATFAAPLAGWCLLLLLYNHARFGSPLEFGLSYVLHGSDTFYDFSRRPDGTLASFFTLRNLSRGLVLYLFAVPELSWSAPYMGEFVVISESVNRMIDMQGVVVETPLISLVLGFPVMLFGSVLPITARRARSKRERPVIMLAFSCLLGAVATLILLSAGRYVAMRYTADVMPGFALGGSMMLMLVLSRIRARDVDWRRVGFAPSLSRWLTGAVVLGTPFIVVSGLIFGLMGWRLAYPPHVTSVYVTLDAVASELRMRVPCHTRTWRILQASYVDEERLAIPLDATCSVWPGGLQPALRSVTVASTLPGPTLVTVEIDGRRVAEERLYPGVQTLLLDEDADTGRDSQLDLQLRFPEEPLPPLSPLWPVGVIGASSRPAFALAQSYREALQERRIDIQRRRGDIELARRALEAARIEQETLRRRLKAERRLDDPDAAPQLQAIEQVITERDQAVRILSDELRPEEDRVEAEMRRIAAKQAIVDAADRR